MTSSPKKDRVIEPLPPALASMWRLCKLGYRHEPRLMAVAFIMSQLAALPDALLALWLMLLGKGFIEHNPGPWCKPQPSDSALSTAANVAAPHSQYARAAPASATKVTIALESHVARLQASVVTVAHQERPEYLDRACRCFAIRCSCSITCTCRYFPRWGWILRFRRLLPRYWHRSIRR